VASQARARTWLQRHEDGGCRLGRCRPRAGAGSTWASCSEKGAGQPRSLRGRWEGECSLGFFPWPLKGIGRLHYFQTFV
jgi:hypothetical protein